MGIHGRDYMRADRRPADVGRLSVTWRLILVNVVLWFLFAISLNASRGGGGLFGFIWDELLLHPEDVFGRLRLWQPFTAFWFHDPRGLGHIFFNMLFLYFFGRYVEEMVGPRTYLRLYVGAGLASTLAVTLLGLTTSTPMVAFGASGCVYALGVFLALRVPNLPIVFIIVPMRLWVLVAVFMVGRELANLALYHGPIGTTVGHLAGAAFGLVFERWLRRGGASRREGGGGSVLGGLRRKADQARESRDVQREQDVRSRVDALLQRIHDEGIGSLTQEEKDFLENASRRFRR